MNQNLSGEVILPDEIFSWSGKTSQYLGFLSKTLRDGESWSGKKAFVGQTFGAKKKKAA